MQTTTPEPPLDRRAALRQALRPFLGALIAVIAMLAIAAAIVWSIRARFPSP
jgi:hypothetical protein